MTIKKLKLIILIIIPTLFILTLLSLWGILNFVLLTPLNTNNTKSFIFEVRPNQNFRQITNLLENKKLIKSSIALQIVAKLKNIDRNVRAGEYLLSPSYSPIEILNRLVNGKPIDRKITIPEGSNLEDIKKVLVSLKFRETDIEQLLKSPKRFGVQADSLEGYLFPDTYHYHKGTKVEDIISLMIQERNNRYKKIIEKIGNSTKLNDHEIITLASIIEKESGNINEHKLISSVFHNRLKRNMKLQSDPTVIYGIYNFNGNITKKDLKTKTPYNTYVIDGLPPGPICSPGESAIRAALSPDTTNYLFFVSTGNGKHKFSQTYKEHSKYVNIYQKKVKRKKQTFSN